MAVDVLCTAMASHFAYMSASGKGIIAFRARDRTVENDRVDTRKLADASITLSIQTASSMTAVVVVVVMIIVSVLVYPQHALYTANYATRHPADSTAYDPANRSGRIIASAGSSPRSLSNALSMRRKRHCKKSYHASGHHRTRFHDTSILAALFPRFCLCPPSLPSQDSIESCPKRYTTFGRSGHRGAAVVVQVSRLLPRAVGRDLLGPVEQLGVNS
jgi:hypothetical protein